MTQETLGLLVRVRKQRLADCLRVVVLGDGSGEIQDGNREDIVGFGFSHSHKTPDDALRSLLKLEEPEPAAPDLNAGRQDAILTIGEGESRKTYRLVEIDLEVTED